MKFTALPVTVGDAFLLRDDNKLILVDGGMSKSRIVKLLNQEKIPNNHIDLLVCTHYDADHINGIIGILKSQKFTFKEIWLPEILGSIGYTLSKNISELLEDLRNNRFSLEKNSYFDNFIFSKRDCTEIHKDSMENNSFEDIDNNVLNNFIKYWHYDVFWHIYGYSEKSLAMSLTLKAIASLISSSLNSGAYIRWFNYSGNTHNTYGYNLYNENAIQTDITIFDSKTFFSALSLISLSNINKYSLVYKYEKENVPDVLFSADSDLHFYSSSVVLKDNSIVTAPHHGSATNNSAYQKISGNNLFYVRSDRGQQARPGQEFLKQSQKYCTICRNNTPKQKVELLYNGTTFVTSAKQCTC